MDILVETIKEYGFTLRVEGDVEAKLNALFEAGCDDASFGSVDGVWHADFDREAESLEEAISSAISDIDSVEGISVRRVEPDDLVTVSDIAERLGRSRESVRLLVNGKRGDGDFPAPFSHGRERNKLWHWFEVAEWSQAKGIFSGEMSGSTARSIMAINSALDLKSAFEAGLPASAQRAVAAIYSPAS